MGRSQSQSAPVFNPATRYVLDSLIEKTENDELEISKKSFWTMAFQYDHRKEQPESPLLNIKNDKAVRGLLGYIEAKGYIYDLKLISRPYAPENVEWLEPHYEFVYAFECRVSNLAKLKQLRRAMEKAPLVTQAVTYIPETGVVTYGDKIALVRGMQQKLLMDVLFRNERSMRQEWAQDEVREAIDKANPDSIKHTWPRNTATGINRKLAAADQLGIKDLLLVTRKSVKINPAYLE